MNSTIEQALSVHRDWLRGLRWVSAAERVLLLAFAALFVIALAVPLVFADWKAVLPAAVGHALLLLAATSIALRRVSEACLALLALSLLNFSILSISPLGGLAMIGGSIGWLGLLSLPFTIVAHITLRHRWQAVAGYRGPDDFRWLLTSAPLILRWQMARALRELPGADAEPPAGR